MSITINSNQAASYSALSMQRANNLLTKSLQRLSSGKRIVSPSDDAGGLAVGMKIESSLKRAQASRLNTQNGISFLQMQDGVLKVAGEILDRMAELKAFPTMSLKAFQTVKLIIMNLTNSNKNFIL